MTLTHRLAAGAAILAIGVVPATAAAHDNHGHHRGQHKTHHAKKHAKKIHRVRVFHAPVAPGTSTPANDDVVATVVSFTDGVLTIKLNDGSTVAGKVDDGTKLECRTLPTAPTTATPRSGGDDNEGDDNGDRGENRGNGDHGDNAGRDDDNDEPGDDDQGDDDEGQQTCPAPADALKPDTKIHKAVLLVTGSGASWKKLELFL